MSKMQALRALVAERLAAAAVEIVGAVETNFTLTEKKMLHKEGMLPDQQRALVHKRLMMVADEIFGILKIMMGEYEAKIACSHQETDCQHKLLDITLKSETSLHRADRLPQSFSSCEKNVSPEQQTSRVQQGPGPPHIKEVSTQSDFEFISQMQRAEKGTSTEKMDSDQEAVSSKHSVGGSEDKGSDTELDEKLQSLKSNKMKRYRRLRESQGTDCCETCGRSFHKGLTVNNKQKNTSNSFGATNKSHKPGQSCCRVCGKFFMYKRSFLKHVLQHEKSANLCGVCGKHLDADDESMEVHVQAHNEENSCRDQTITDEKRLDADCSEAESKMGDSDEEWKETEGSESDDGGSDKDQTKEGPCLQKLESKAKIQETLMRLKDKGCSNLSQLKYCCKVCGKSFSYRASFLKHAQKEERDVNLCGVCGTHFESKESLRLHLQTYTRTNDCEVCGKHFDSHIQLEMHMRTHTGEKPYICGICGKAFAQNGNLMGHMRAHTGERPYVCSVCSQSFSFKEYMMAHMRIHSGEKPFLCSVCGKGFRQRGTLKTHMMIHTGESTHRCSVCDKRFYKSGALKIHMRSHTGEKPYLCNICGKCFTASGSLTKHMSVHEGERAHCCSICAKGFPRKEDLKKHVQTHRDESTQLTRL